MLHLLQRGAQILAAALGDIAQHRHKQRFFGVGGDADVDFTEANLDLAVRWAEGPGDLEGVALGSAERVTAGEGDWIAWPGDPMPEGDDCESPPLSVGDAGQAIAAAAAGMGKARVPALLAQSWLDNGRIAALGEPAPSRHGYWLVAPLPQWRQKKVKALVAFLTA